MGIHSGSRQIPTASSWNIHEYTIATSPRGSSVRYFSQVFFGFRTQPSRYEKTGLFPDPKKAKAVDVTLSETNIAPENWLLEDEISFWDGLFSGAMLVSGNLAVCANLRKITGWQWEDKKIGNETLQLGFGQKRVGALRILLPPTRDLRHDNNKTGRNPFRTHQSKIYTLEI